MQLSDYQVPSANTSRTTLLLSYHPCPVSKSDTYQSGMQGTAACVATVIPAFCRHRLFLQGAGHGGGLAVMKTSGQ
eukprot:1160114-Pelagomonas_calceolata.AAC.12